MLESISKFWRAPRKLICIFKIKLLNVQTTNYDFFLTLGSYLYELTPLTARMLLGRDINAAMQRAN